MRAGVRERIAELLGPLCDPDDFSDARSRWLRGECPCCGASPDWSIAEPVAIGEGVLICGRCAENGHLDTDGITEAFLLAILP